MSTQDKNSVVVWSLFAVGLMCAPWIFHSGSALSLLSQMGIWMILGLSYNMLLGQGGMLSFGHTVYSGLGGFCAIHVMNFVIKGVFTVPVTCIPLVGGIAGMFFGILFGYVTTKKSGITFAMITLGMVELVSSGSLMFASFFGGEGGITTNRVMGEAFLGVTYGPQIQVYYLIAFWLFISAVAMAAFTKTPLGLMINAVRDNAERAEFIGYDAQWVRYLTLIVSAFFAGISGALSAINFEIISAENVSAHQSGALLLFTFIGGVGFFWGPVIGAVLNVFFVAILSAWTHAWQLYIGIFFIVIVLFAPEGVAGWIAVMVRLIKQRKVKQMGAALWKPGIFFGLGCTGVVLGIEMLYRLALELADSSRMTWLGVSIDVTSGTVWLCVVLTVVVGWVGFVCVQPELKETWASVQNEIEVEK